MEAPGLQQAADGCVPVLAIESGLGLDQGRLDARPADRRLATQGDCLVAVAARIAQQTLGDRQLAVANVPVGLGDCIDLLLLGLLAIAENLRDRRL